MAARIELTPQAAFAGTRTRGLIHLVGRYRYDAPGIHGRLTYADEQTLCGRKWNRRWNPTVLVPEEHASWPGEHMEAEAEHVTCADCRRENEKRSTT